jgi:hypothetical protein
VSVEREAVLEGGKEGRTFLRPVNPIGGHLLTKWKETLNK